MNHVSPLLGKRNIYTHHPKELKPISALRGRHPVLCSAHPCSGRWEMQGPVPHSTLRHSAKSQRVSIRERQLERGPSWPRNSYSISWTTIATRTKCSCDAGAPGSAGQNAQLQKQLQGHKASLCSLKCVSMSMRGLRWSTELLHRVLQCHRPRCRGLVSSLGPGLALCVWQGVRRTHRGVCFHSKTKWQFRKADPAKENPGKPRRMKQ